MFKNIVWATDGSESADRALAYAKELASRSDAKLYAVHSEEHLSGGRSSGVSVRADEDVLRSTIRAQVETARTEGFDASFETVRCAAGRTPNAIADFAQSVAADVVVVGTRGHSPLAGVLLGSVTQGLLHSAPCPVLAVPPAAVPARKDEALAVAGA
ncbi:MAG TPA: universal stress protein [Gaiellaceae bacterium]|nr:universal stress protein [Gaiellaceae bacterium]